VPSGAGLNRVGQRGGRILLATNLATATANATPLVSYGTIGVNDSGACMFESIAFSKTVFQVLGSSSIVGTGTANGAFTIYGTVSQAAYELPIGSTAVSPGDWIELPAPATETAGDTAAWANPILVGNFAGFSPTFAYFNVAPMVAYRVVYTVAQTGLTAGIVSVVAFAVP
jgi:hypothetical protein